MKFSVIWKAFLELFRLENTSIIFRIHCAQIRLANVKELRWGSSEIVQAVLSKHELLPVEHPFSQNDREVDVKRSNHMHNEFSQKCPCFEFNKKGEREPERLIIYFHGGAFVHQPGPPHWQIIRRLCVELNSRVFLPVYPKAPMYSQKESLHYIFSITKKIIEKESCSLQLVIMGDSAGGNIATVVTMMLRDRSLRTPSQVILISPWTDLTLSTPEIASQNEKDPWLNEKGILEAARMWAGDKPLAHPLISPINGDLSNLPPISIFTGSRELFFHDQKRFYKKLLQAGNLGGNYFEVSGMIHCYPILPIPEAEVAWEQIVSILNNT